MPIIWQKDYLNPLYSNEGDGQDTTTLLSYLYYYTNPPPPPPGCSHMQTASKMGFLLEMFGIIRVKSHSINWKKMISRKHENYICICSQSKSEGGVM